MIAPISLTMQAHQWLQHEKRCKHGDASELTDLPQKKNTKSPQGRATQKPHGQGTHVTHGQGTHVT